jgi:hypothetical protein
MKLFVGPHIALRYGRAVTISAKKAPPSRQPDHMMGLSMTTGYRFLIFSDLHAAPPMSSSAAKQK